MLVSNGGLAPEKMVYSSSLPPSCAVARARLTAVRSSLGMGTLLHGRVWVPSDDDAVTMPSRMVNSTAPAAARGRPAFATMVSGNL